MGKISFDYSGQSVIITGGARGIGLELGRAFANWGAAVTLVDFDEEALSSAAAEIGQFGVRADVADTEDVERAVGEVMNRTGRVDILVNNAGILRDGVVWKLSDRDWDDVIDTHSGGTFRFTRAVVPHMRAQGYGRIVNITSYTGLRGNTGQSNYAMAKAGIIGFTKSTAKELARFNITVNALSPNAETQMIASIPADKRAALESSIPLGRFGTAVEMAPSVGFLASSAAGYITGVVLPVDGGISI